MKETIQNFSYLHYKDDNLFVYENMLKKLIEGIKSPFLMYIPQRFSENYHSLKNAISENISSFSIHYAVKANYLGKVLLDAKKLGMGLEVMSLFEMLLAKKGKFDFQKIIFNGPSKSVEELNFAIDSGIKRINIDSMEELLLIEKLVQKKNQKLFPVTIRIHPKLREETEKRLLIKKNSKLGIDYERGKKLFKYAQNSDFLEPRGVHVHVGTNLHSQVFYDELLEFINSYIKQLSEKEVIIREINLGGGLASAGILKNSGFSLSVLSERIAHIIDNVDNYHLLFEPGRYLIGDSFIAIAKVLRTKKSWGRKWSYVDIGANTLVPLRYSKYYTLPLHYKGKGQYCNIGGPLCLPVDVLSNHAVDFEINTDDYLVVLNCGAYTLSMSEQFGYPRPAVYELSSNKLILIKEADDIEKMVNEAFVNTDVG